MTREEAFDRRPHTVQMRQDLQDPSRRIAVREEYKQGLPRSYPDLLEQVQLTEAQRDALFDLLADFQMRQMSADPATQSGIAFATARRMDDPEP
jgi:hypothetical protein